MSREVHVRFCERPKVKFLRPTHPYIPIGRGFLYLVAIMDWCSRMVLAWQLSNTMDVSFCVAALEQALARFGKPEIFNTDQGSQFTSGEFTGALAAAGVRISMDGRGRWMDNIFIERLWRSLKHEEVYLQGYADGLEARSGISRWLSFYNLRRPHQALGDQAPIAVWRNGMTGSLPDMAVDMALRLDDPARRPHAHSRNNDTRQHEIQGNQSGAGTNLIQDSDGPPDGVHLRVYSAAPSTEWSCAPSTGRARP
jgi:hypothetical protein